MANNNNANQFRDDAIIILDQLRDGIWIESIHPKIGGRLRLGAVLHDRRPLIRGFAQPRAL
jgi:hypothetical protein